MRTRVKGRLGSKGLLAGGHGMAARARFTSTGLQPVEFIMPEPAVNGIVIGAGVFLGLLGYNVKDAPLGLFLISVGGGLGALGTAYFIRSLLSKQGPLAKTEPAKPNAKTAVKPANA